MKRIMKLMLTLLLLASSSTLLAQDRTFAVSVSFEPDYASPVNVELTCNSGIPLVQDFDITEDLGIVFSVNMVFDGSTCAVSQEPVDGYATFYYANDVFSETDCTFQGENLLVANTCEIVNTGQAAPISKGPVSAYETVEQFGFIPGYESELVMALCPEGKKVLGGGYMLISGGAWQIISLGPTPGGDGYLLEMSSMTEEPQEVVVTAICAKVSMKPQ